MLQKDVSSEYSRMQIAIRDALDHALALGDDVTAVDLSLILHTLTFGRFPYASDVQH